MKFVLYLAMFTTLAALAETPQQLAVRYKTAQKNYSVGANEKVIELLNPYSEELGAAGLVLLSAAYSAKEEYAEEVRIMKTLVSKNENNYQAYMLLGQAYQKQALTSKNETETKKLRVLAVQTFRQCLKLRSSFKPAYDSLLETLVTLKDNNESREVVTEGIQKFGALPQLLNHMCRLDATGGFVTQAVSSCKDSVAAAPNYPDSYVYLSQALADQKENGASEKTITGAANRFPASEFVQWAAGTVFMKKQNYPVSARFFNQAIKADPTSSRANFGYAQALFASGKAEEALPVYTRACKLDPTLVMDNFLAAGSKLRQKGDDSMGQRYKEMATTCHNR